MNISDLLIYGDTFGGGGSGGESSRKSFAFAWEQNTDWLQFFMVDLGGGIIVRITDYMTVDEIDSILFMTVVGDGVGQRVAPVVCSRENGSLLETEVGDGLFAVAAVDPVTGEQAMASFPEDTAAAVGIPSGLYVPLPILVNHAGTIVIGCNATIAPVKEG